MTARRLHADLSPGLAATTCPSCASIVTWQVPDRPLCRLCGWEMPAEFWGKQRSHKGGQHPTPSPSTAHRIRATSGKKTDRPETT